MAGGRLVALGLLAAACNDHLVESPLVDLAGVSFEAGQPSSDMAVTACSSAGDCPAGWTCDPLAGGTTMVCRCTPGPETCDAKDNDCDGVVDNGTPCGAFAACSTAAVCVQCTPSTAHKAQFVVSQVVLPMNRLEFSIDLNGDGRADNQLANIVAVLGSQNLDPSLSVQAAITAGNALMLIETHSADASFMSDGCAQVVLEYAVAHAAPDFSGAGSFTVDTNIAPSDFVGAYAQGQYASEPPVATLFPVSITIELALFGFTPAKLSLVGAHIQFTQTPTGLMQGQIQGAIRQSDVQTLLIPGIADGANQRVMADPTSPTAMELLQIFDTNLDNTITADEVANNGLIKAVLTPDVQLFNGTTFQPNPDNAMKDSLSIGIAFTAVKATF